MSAPNQRKLIINKEVCDKNHLYTAINLDALQNAMKDLIPIYPAAFELWIYFSKNQNNYHTEVSSKDIADNYGISRDRYQKAWKILVDKGYIVETNKNSAQFYEIPKQENPVIDNRKIQSSKTGKSSLQKQDFPARNNTNNTINNTLYTTVSGFKEKEDAFKF